MRFVLLVKPRPRHQSDKDSCASRFGSGTSRSEPKSVGSLGFPKHCWRFLAFSHSLARQVAVFKSEQRPKPFHFLFYRPGRKGTHSPFYVTSQTEIYFERSNETSHDVLKGQSSPEAPKPLDLGTVWPIAPFGEGLSAPCGELLSSGNTE